MAERRMFAKTIVDSDAFLDMPLSSQALYFHLAMRADDEGFINSPKKIQRITGASDDDMKVLIAKKFVIAFESGVVVIKHWKIHNYIRGDRLVETKYKEERALLEVKENGAYTISSELEKLETLDASDLRKQAYKKSTLPYGFDYKVKRAFYGKICPICGKKMSSETRCYLPTIQHNIPITKGGMHEIENISVICLSCNTSVRDRETEGLNNAEVINMWEKIVYAERHGIKWFYNPEILENIDVSQMSGACQSDDSVGQSSDSIGKDRLGKDRLVEDRLGKGGAGGTRTGSHKRTSKVEKNLEILQTIGSGYGFDDFVYEKLTEWMKYKGEIGFVYKEQGAKSFFTQTKKSLEKYGADAVVSAIDTAIASGWKGFYPEKTNQTVSGGIDWSRV